MRLLPDAPPGRSSGLYAQIDSEGANTSTMTAVLRLEDVSCVRHGRLVVDRVSLCVAPGQVTLLRGARGAGKSTLLAIAAAAVRPGAGRVVIGGRDILGLQSSSLPFVRRNVGYLPPEPPLVNDESALENVMLALAVRGHDAASAGASAVDSLRAVGFPDAATRVPVKDLSWGERRLVAVARAMVGAPPLIVLDEPAAGLDADDREAVAMAMGVAQSLGSAVICGSADPSFATLLTQAGAETEELESGRLVGGPRMTVLRGDRATPLPPEDGAARAEVTPEQTSQEELDAADLVDDEDDYSLRGKR